MMDPSNTGGPSTLVNLTFKGISDITFAFGRDDVYSRRNGIRIGRTTTEGTLDLLLSGYEPDSTLQISGLFDQKLDVVKAVRSGLFELVDAGIDEMVVIQNHLVQDDSKPRRLSSPEFPIPYEEDIYFIWNITDPFWRNVIQPGGTYHLRFSKDKGTSLCRYTQLDVPSINDISQYHELGSGSVQRDSRFLTIHVRDELPPPQLTGSLKLPNDICYLPKDLALHPFEVILTVTNPTSRPLTLEVGHTSLGTQHKRVSLYVETLFNRFRFVDKTTGARVGKMKEDDDDDFICTALWIETRSWWEFQELLPGQSFDTRLAVKYERTHFIPGHEYTLEPYASAFKVKHWRYGRKSELIDASIEKEWAVREDSKSPPFWKEFGGWDAMNGTIKVDWKPHSADFKVENLREDFDGRAENVTIGVSNERVSTLDELFGEESSREGPERENWASIEEMEELFEKGSIREEPGGEECKGVEPSREKLSKEEPTSQALSRDDSSSESLESKGPDEKVKSAMDALKI